MHLDKNGKLAQFYRWSYCENWYVPENLCNFFWAMLWAVLWLPLTILSYPFDATGLFGRVAQGFGVLIGITFLAAVTASTWVGNWVPLFAIGAIIAGVVLLGFGMFLWEVISEKWQDGEFTTLKEVTSVIGSQKRSFKDKFCPRIEWR